MQQNSYQKKYAKLKPWINDILNAVKKDLKNEHLRKDQLFIQKYFPKKFVNKLPTEEIIEAYHKELNEGNEEIGEWIATRWIMKHAEIYQLFAQVLSTINSKFDEIQEIPQEKASFLLNQSVSQFGAISTYIFSILNAATFTEADFERLRSLAEKEVKEDQEVEIPVVSLEAVKEKYEGTILKLVDKYEQRLLGIQKKYTQDVEGLKKQIAQLQRRFNG